MMKIFFYKTILVAIVFFIAFKLTIGSLINQTESKIRDLTSKESVEMIKMKIRKEMQNAIEKDDYIKRKMQLSLGFINKIKSELN